VPPSFRVSGHAGGQVERLSPATFKAGEPFSKTSYTPQYSRKSQRRSIRKQQKTKHLVLFGTPLLPQTVISDKETKIS
jgi:hypothetical protein